MYCISSLYLKSDLILQQQYYFFTVNNNAAITYLQNSLFPPVPVFLWNCGLSLSFSLFKFNMICYATGIPVEVGVKFIIKPLDCSCFLKHAMRK